MGMYLHLGIGPPRDLHDHVQYGLLFICIEWNVVERRNNHSVFLDVDAVFGSIGSAVLSDGVLAWGVGIVALVTDG